MAVEIERRLILAIQGGLPLVPQPYLAVARELGITEEEVIILIDGMLADGRIKRIGAVPNHYALGIIANGMSVWNVPDHQVAEVGRRMGQLPVVTHCYRRPRRPPHWPYNLFAMVHGYSREDVLVTVDGIARELELEGLPREVIFSTQLLKKTGVRFQEGWASLGRAGLAASSGD
ncbi:MAG: Lrp/AsnC family transcriptional regulator [Chloroflexi bacterium]|nr:Lrp/AsnC family transcriptional regulator [Chloroflexota bacterium]